MKQKNGFTLIELLAVIVILAIIALIATPIVLNIIKDSKENAQLRSAEFYLDAVEQSITKKMMDDPTFKPSSCEIQADGNLKCKGIDVKVEVSGENPSSGTVAFKKGKITDVELILSEKTIVKNNECKLVYVNLKYKLGDEITFNPGDVDRTWNVIGEGIDTVTLMLTENLGNTVIWHSSDDNNYGPKDVLDYLNSLTTEWDNVDIIENYSYVNNLGGTEKTNGYQKIEIINGITTITHKDGTSIKLDERNKSKAIILSLEDIFKIASKTNKNLTKEKLKEYIIRNLAAINAALEKTATDVAEVINFLTDQEDYEWLKHESEYIQLYYTVGLMVFGVGIEPTYDILLPSYLYQNLGEPTTPDGYWTLSAFSSDPMAAWDVNYSGDLGFYRVKYSSDNGVRPVITIPKSKLN